MATFCNQKILSFIMHISSSTNTTTTDVPWQLASLLLPQCDAERWEVGSRGKACMKSDNMKICQHSWKAFRQRQSTELPAGLKKACSASQLSPPGSCISITWGGLGLIGPGWFSPSSQELCRAAEQVGKFLVMLFINWMGKCPLYFIKLSTCLQRKGETCFTSTTPHQSQQSLACPWPPQPSSHDCVSPHGL